MRRKDLFLQEKHFLYLIQVSIFTHDKLFAQQWISRFSHAMQKKCLNFYTLSSKILLFQFFCKVFQKAFFDLQIEVLNTRRCRAKSNKDPYGSSRTPQAGRHDSSSISDSETDPKQLFQMVDKTFLASPTYYLIKWVLHSVEIWQFSCHSFLREINHGRRILKFFLTVLSNECRLFPVKSTISFISV